MTTSPRLVPTAFDQQAAQRRTVTTLSGSQMLGGIGVASGIAVMALLARDLSGSEELAGLGTTTQVLGGALLAVPVSRVMARHGRRPGLLLGYGVAILGSALVIAATMLRSFPLLILGTALFGGATTANSQSRFAATDLAMPKRRGRDLSLVVWATTVGSILGPNLVEVADDAGAAIGLPRLAGSFVFALVGFMLAAVFLAVRLRPDPLILARSLAGAEVHSTGSQVASPPGSQVRTHEKHRSIAHSFRVIVAHPRALLGLITISTGHAVMVSVMVMTPLHMDHGGATLRLIGLVISLHILGMYAFSPLVGSAVDRVGARPVALIGAGILILSCTLASFAHEGMSGLITVALLLLGVGWSCAFVSGSSMLAASLPLAERPAAQGVADLCMGLAGGGGGALAGVVIGVWGYGTLAIGCAALSLIIVVSALVIRDQD